MLLPLREHLARLDVHEGAATKVELGAAVLRSHSPKISLIQFHWNWPLWPFQARIWLGAEPTWRCRNTPRLGGVTALGDPLLMRKNKTRVPENCAANKGKMRGEVRK